MVIDFTDGTTFSCSIEHKLTLKSVLFLGGTDAIATKVKQEFAAKEKAKKEAKPMPSGGAKNRKAA